MPVTLLLATEQDIAQLSHLGCVSYRHHFSQLWHSAAELDQYLDAEYGQPAIRRSLLQKNINWFVIKTTQLIGLVKLSYGQNIADETYTGTLINKIYLQPEATGQGYGYTIFQWIENIAKQQGDHFIWLEVLASNPAAKHFYEKCGMHVIKETLFTSNNQQCPMYIMGKTL